MSYRNEFLNLHHGRVLLDLHHKRFPRQPVGASPAEGGIQHASQNTPALFHWMTWLGARLEGCCATLALVVAAHRIGYLGITMGVERRAACIDGQCTVWGTLKCRAVAPGVDGRPWATSDKCMEPAQHARAFFEGKNLCTAPHIYATL